MAELIGNVLVVQVGGATAVTNSILTGIVSGALNHECIEEIYGALNGVKGILNEDLIDLAAESQQVMRALKYTPGPALGMSLIGEVKKGAEQERIYQVIKAHNIRYLLCIGGRPAVEFANNVVAIMGEKQHELRVIVVPCSVDNELPITDHCLGYGSAIKHLAILVKELELSYPTIDNQQSLCIIEVSGENSGWLAAGANLVKRRGQDEDVSVIVCLPEVAFSPENFLSAVQNHLKKNRCCAIVTTRKLLDENGNYLATEAGKVAAGEVLANLIQENLGVSSAVVPLTALQGVLMHGASEQDSEEAFICGQAAVDGAVNGESSKVVTLLRGESERYDFETSFTDINSILNGKKSIPQEWLSEDGLGTSVQFSKYAQPFIQGELKLQFEHGLPKFTKLERHKIDKVLSVQF